MTLVAVTLIGLALFLWPFLGLGLPSATPALAISIGSVAALAGLELAGRRLDPRRLALLAARTPGAPPHTPALVTGIGGFSPIFFLVLCAGWVMGPSFGFLTGASSLLVSALVTGGIGPWIPYQLFAVGWVGAGAGLAGRALATRGRPRARDVLLLGGLGALLGFGFGALMDVWNWTFYTSSPGLGWSPGLAPQVAAGRFARYYLITSLAYDSFRAGGNALMVGLFGLPVMVGLARLRRRFSLVILPGSGQPADHDAAGQLVMPGLLAGVDRGPEQAQTKATEVEQVATQPDQAATEA